jgi:hypothetical protein
MPRDVEKKSQDESNAPEFGQSAGHNKRNKSLNYI